MAKHFVNSNIKIIPLSEYVVENAMCVGCDNENEEDLAALEGAATHGKIFVCANCCWELKNLLEVILNKKTFFNFNTVDYL